MKVSAIHFGLVVIIVLFPWRFCFSEEEAAVPKVEIFGGYSLLVADFEVHREEAHGWGASIASNINKNIGVVADFSGHFKHSDFVPGADRSARTYTSTFLFGPRLTMRRTKVTVFANPLIGGRNIRREGFSETNFAIGLGGGLDYKHSERVAFRVFQVDYIPTRVDGDWSSHFRAEFGFVFKFGRRT